MRQTHHCQTKCEKRPLPGRPSMQQVEIDARCSVCLHGEPVRVEGGYGLFIRYPTAIMGKQRTTWWYRGAANYRCWSVAHFLLRCSLFLADNDIDFACAEVACQWSLRSFGGYLGHVGPSWQSAVFARAAIAAISDCVWGIMACPYRAVDPGLWKRANASGFCRSVQELFGAFWLVKSVTQRCRLCGCSD